MANLIAAALVFLALHRIVSGSRLREALVGAFGEALYLRLFAIASAAGLFWLGFAFMRARPEDVGLWVVPRLALWLQPAIQLIAFVLVACGLVTPNPGTVGQQQSVNRLDIVRGILRITRHPFPLGCRNLRRRPSIRDVPCRELDPVRDAAGRRRFRDHEHRCQATPTTR